MMKELPPLRFLAIWLWLVLLAAAPVCSALQKLLLLRRDTNDETLFEASIDSHRLLRRTGRALWLCVARAHPCGSGTVSTWIAACSARGSVFAWVLPCSL